METKNNGLCLTFQPRCHLMLSELQIANTLKITQRILGGFRPIVSTFNILIDRISVSNEPELEINWEVVLLEGSFEKDGLEASSDITRFQLDSLVNEKRFIKFEIISFGGNGGCIQYFDVDRNTKDKKSGKCEILISRYFLVLPQKPFTSRV